MCDRSHLSKKDLDAIEWHQLKQSAARLHALGPLPLAYFLAEIARGRDPSETLNRYAAMSPEQVRAVGADTVDATTTAAASALAYMPPTGSA